MQRSGQPQPQPQPQPRHMFPAMQPIHMYPHIQPAPLYTPEQMLPQQHQQQQQISMQQTQFMGVPMMPLQPRMMTPQLVTTPHLVRPPFQQQQPRPHQPAMHMPMAPLPAHLQPQAQMPPPHAPIPPDRRQAPAEHMLDRHSEANLQQTHAKAPSDALDASAAQWYQQLLDTNEELMQAIVENMQIGRFEDCVHHHKLLQANLVKLAQRADALAHASTDPYASLLDVEDRFYSVNLLKDLDAHIQAKPETVEGEGPRIDVILQLMQQEAMSHPASHSDTTLEACAECQSNGIPGAVCRRQLNHTAAASDNETQANDSGTYQQPLGSQFVMPAPVTQFPTLPSSMAKPAQPKRKYNKWSPDEEARLRTALTMFKSTDWKSIAEYVGTRSRGQCRSRYRTLKEKSQRDAGASQTQDDHHGDGVVSEEDERAASLPMTAPEPEQHLSLLLLESNSFLDNLPNDSFLS